MIENMTIEGRPATVQYLTADFRPIDAANAEMVRIVFEDGETRWAFPSEDDKTPDEKP
jgi:hypothetical protein